MKKSQFEHVLRVVSDLCQEKEFVVIGASALFATVSEPPEILTLSRDVDLYPKNYPEKAELIQDELGLHSDFYRQHKYHADGVGPNVATLPEGWESRLVRFTNKETGGAIAYCLDVHDLAVAKLIANRPKDLAGQLHLNF